MKVDEIFYSIQGEGTRIGTPTIFIRTMGCNLNCWYCDTDQTNRAPHTLTNEQIINICQGISKNPNTAICITGGEPMLQIDKDILELLSLYYKDISIETNGTIPLIVNRPPSVSYVMDYKTDDLLNDKQMEIRDSNLSKLSSLDELKIVLKDTVELHYILKNILGRGEYKIIVSPIWDDDLIETSKDLIKVIKEFRTNRVRFQHQLHKHIWGNKRGV